MESGRIIVDENKQLRQENAALEKRISSVTTAYENQWHWWNKAHKQFEKGFRRKNKHIKRLQAENAALREQLAAKDEALMELKSKVKYMTDHEVIDYINTALGESE